MKTYGRLRWEEFHKDARWLIQAEPHILLRFKRIFEKIHKHDHGTLLLADTLENCRDLEWAIHRYPLEVKPEDLERLQGNASQHRDQILRLEQMIDPHYVPRKFEMALPAREYQARAAEILLQQGSLLILDDVGLGKTCTAICSFSDPRTLPALVVCYPFLQRQWRDEIQRFMPDLHVHIVKKGRPYELPKFMGRGPDVIIISYHKLSGWAETLGAYVRMVVFDECQELRRTESAKYSAAKHVAGNCKFTTGLSATPIFNYGVEMFNICDVVTPGKLGRREEFLREWCRRTIGDRVDDPAAFGSYLRESFTVLRRTRKEVGRELPDLVKVPYQIDIDRAPLQEIHDSAHQLASMILQNGPELFKGERLSASEQLSNMLRQATGVAKAPHAADFIRLLLESEEKIVVGAWHRSVWDVLYSRLKEFKVEWFTGTESGSAKETAKQNFVEGDSRLLFVSLRSGAGLDGLQKVCRTAVIAELDWSPAVLTQFIGRIYRDGQLDPVTAYLLLSDRGADPVMSEVLGLKREQLQGVLSQEQELVEQLESGAEHAKRLAEHYLHRQEFGRSGE